MEKIRAAVVGVGYLGRFHAQKYAEAAGCELLAVVDEQAQAREQVSAELKVRALADYHELLGKVDAVSVVTPTTGLSAANAMPRAAESPTRKPVKLPGPVVTAMRSRPLKAMPDAFMTRAISGIRASAWPRTIGTLRLATMPP